jgi:DNA-binding NtrC family response regulator
MATNTHQPTNAAETVRSFRAALLIEGDVVLAEQIRVLLESHGLRLRRWKEGESIGSGVGGDDPMAIRSPETNETWVVSAGPSAEEFETLKGVRSDADPEVDSMQSLHRLEWSYIQRVLSDCGGNISAAARKLGIHRRSLQRKLAKVPPQR